MNQLNVPPSAVTLHSAQAQTCGDLSSPQAAVGAGRPYKFNRVITFKIEPTPEQWKTICDLAWQVAAAKNAMMLAKWAHAMKLVPSPEFSDKHNSAQLVRQQFSGDLSAAVYDGAAHAEVEAQWKRHAKRILAGAPIPQWREADSLIVRADKSSTGVQIRYDCPRYVLSLRLQSRDVGERMEIMVARGTSADEWIAPMLDRIIAGQVSMGTGRIVIKRKRGKMLFKLSIGFEGTLPNIGERVATLGPLSGAAEGKRLLLRSELQTIDYTHRYVRIMQMKTDFDGLRRRIAGRVGRRKHGSRTKRELFDRNQFSDWAKEHCHQWSREVIDWCKSQGVGVLHVLDLGGGDWPAYQFMEMLKYKGEEVGIAVDEGDTATLEEASTDRAAKQLATKKRAKAKKLGESIREIEHQLRGE